MDNHSNGPRKKILLLGEVNSPHFQKWLAAIADDYEVRVCSLSAPTSLSQPALGKIDFKGHYGWQAHESTYFKLRYFSVIRRFKQVHKAWRPDIVHAHYATSYGLFAKLMKPECLFVSVWGSDVFEFPNKSALHKRLLSSILNACQKVFSTSYVMKEATAKLTNTPIQVIPFGVDTKRFNKQNREKQSDTLNVGMVKMLEHVYGIDTLIRTVAALKEEFPNLMGHLYGSGSQEDHLKALADSLGVKENIHFHGRIPNDEVPEKLNQLDVYCAFSRAESFGVSAVEANACEVPVVATKVNGLMEVIEHGENGWLVENDLPALTEGLRFLLNDAQLRAKMGKQGRELVLKKYDWNENVKMMKQAYDEIG